MDSRSPAALNVLAILLGVAIVGLFLATGAPLRTALLWGLTSTALVLFTIRSRQAPPDDHLGFPESPAPPPPEEP